MMFNRREFVALAVTGASLLRGKERIGRSRISAISDEVATSPDDAIAFAGMPGEPFVEFQMQLRAQSPVPASFLIGYTNGYFAYFPTIAAAVRGGYGANSTVNPTEVGVGESLLNTALVSLYELLGRLKPEAAVP